MALIDIVFLMLIFSMAIVTAVRESQLRATLGANGAYNKGAFAACSFFLFVACFFYVIAIILYFINCIIAAFITVAKWLGIYYIYKKLTKNKSKKPKDVMPEPELPPKNVEIFYV
jgi:Flp pilus assembly protein TadB